MAKKMLTTAQKTNMDLLLDLLHLHPHHHPHHHYHHLFIFYFFSSSLLLLFDLLVEVLYCASLIHFFTKNFLFAFHFFREYFSIFLFVTHDNCFG